MSKKFNYFPILKTTDAELKGYEHLEQSVKSGILPIFELTQSRRSPKNPTRAIVKSIEKIKNLIGINPFILDLTTESQLQNEEIERIFENYQNGYEEWVQLVRSIKDEKYNIIPVIHYNPFCLDDVALEIKNLLKLSDVLVFRTSIFEDDLLEYVENILQNIDPSKLILILDGEFLSLGDGVPDKSLIFAKKLKEISDKFPGLKAIACAYSSFPDSVVRKGYGSVNEGSFPRSEKITRNALKSSLKLNNFFFSDYASTHPKRYFTSGAQWIPRIDFLDNNYMMYYRFKRDNGGYIAAAKRVINDSRYKAIESLDIWGDNEIRSAAGGYPNGLSPSHWISVRINLYISWQFLELKNENQMIL